MRANQDFMPLPSRDERRVCRRCHIVIDDCEPFGRRGEWVHPRRHRDGTASVCQNAGKPFFDGDKEIMPFMRKATRRRTSRTRGR